MYTIGLDLGTGAVKGVCRHTERGIVKKISRRLDFNRPAPDHIEIDPVYYLNEILKIISELADGADAPVSGIAFAAASGNTMLCSPAGEPLTPIISWLDTRLKDWMPPEEWQVRETTGWLRIPTFPLMHLEYFKRTCPELLARSHIAMNNDFLVWQLCGNHTLDHSNTAPFYLWDQKNYRFADHISYYGITPEQLPQIVPTGSVAGFLKPEYCHGNLTEKTAIVNGCFDHPAGARGAGILTPGNMLLSCGTSWVGFYPVQDRNAIPPNELCDTFQSRDGGCYGAMFSVAKIGVDVENFVCSRYGSTPERYEKFNDEALAGDTPAREMMLSVINRFKERFDQHSGIKRIVLSGGPSEGRAWHKLIEETLKVKVEVSPYLSYTGAAGAALIAGGFIK